LLAGLWIDNVVGCDAVRQALWLSVRMITSSASLVVWLPIMIVTDSPSFALIRPLDLRLARAEPVRAWPPIVPAARSAASGRV
jgi:hypothetical protein